MPALRRTWLVAGLAGLVSCAHGVGAEGAASFAQCAAALPGPSVSEVPFQPSRLRGKVVLVTFIATWCFPCLADLVSLDKLERELGPKGFENVVVGMDLEGAQVLVPFAANYQFQYPVIAATESLRSGETPFGRIRELPTRVLFGRDGQVVGAWAGVFPWPTLSKTVADEVGRK